MKLIDEMENNVDALVVDSEIAFQVLDQTRSSNVGIGKARFDIDLSRNEPLLLDPEFQRRCLDARRGQKFLLAHDHDRLPSRGLNSLPLVQLDTNASSSGSGDFGKTTFSFTSSSPLPPPR